MKFFSDCSGGCRDCAVFYWGGCLAGHGDDDFSPMTEEIAKQIIDYKRKKNSSDLEWTINELKAKYPDLQI